MIKKRDDEVEVKFLSEEALVIALKNGNVAVVVIAADADGTCATGYAVASPDADTLKVVKEMLDKASSTLLRVREPKGSN